MKPFRERLDDALVGAAGTAVVTGAIVGTHYFVLQVLACFGVACLYLLPRRR